MNTKDIIVIVIVAAVAGFGAGFLIYNQTKIEPQVIGQFESANESLVSQTEILEEIRLISQRSPVIFPVIIEERGGITQNSLPSEIRELLPTASSNQNIQVRTMVFDPGQDGFLISYTDNNRDIYNSHRTVLMATRNAVADWNENYEANGAVSAVTDVSNEDYLIRIIEEAVDESVTKINLYVVEL